MSDKPQEYPWIVSYRWNILVDFHPIARFAYECDADNYAKHLLSINPNLSYEVEYQPEQEPLT